MDEPSIIQKLAAEAFGTAFLVFIGVGSVPATIIVNGDAPFTMADLGMISFAFATVVVATIYALGHISGNHINPAVTLGLAVTGKFPWSRVPAYITAQVVGAIVGAAAIIGVLGMAARDAGLGVATYSGDTPQGLGGIRRCRHRFGGVRGDHPGGTDHGRLDQPGPHVRPDARPAARWRLRLVGAAAGVPGRRTARRRPRGVRLCRDLPHPRRCDACAQPVGQSRARRPIHDRSLRSQP
jgi:hypothetical protein